MKEAFEFMIGVNFVFLNDFDFLTDLLLLNLVDPIVKYTNFRHIANILYSIDSQINLAGSHFTSFDFSFRIIFRVFFFVVVLSDYS